MSGPKCATPHWTCRSVCLSPANFWAARLRKQGDKSAQIEATAPRSVFRGLLPRRKQSPALALDVGPFAERARQPRSVGRNTCASEKSVAGASTRAHPRQVDAKQALVALYDLPATMTVSTFPAWAHSTTTPCGLFIGMRFRLSVSMSTMSASLPGVREPVSASRPQARAPWTVANRARRGSSAARDRRCGAGVSPHR